MAIESGFFNSVNGDRKYNALDFGKMFDGVITDGIFASVGTKMIVTKDPVVGMKVNVGIGKAWFKNSWISNTAIIPFTLAAASNQFARIDAVVIEINRSDLVRQNTIKVLQGNPSATPQNPTLTNANGVYQYPLCYILVGKSVTTLYSSNITSMVGTAACPLVSGAVQASNADLLAAWRAEFDSWFATLASILDSNTAANLTTRVLALEQKIEVVSTLPAQVTNGKILLKTE